MLGQLIDLYKVIRENLLPFIGAALLGLLIWWKQIVSSQASQIVSSKSATQAPTVEVTIGSFTRKALAVPKRLLTQAVKLGEYYVDFVMAAPLVVTNNHKIADVILSDRFICDRLVYNAEKPGVLGANGPYHQRLRRILQAALSDPKSSKAFANAIQKRLKSEAFPELDQASTMKEPFDLLPVFEELFTDAISLWVVGYPIDNKVEVERLVEARRTLANLTFIVPQGINWYFDRIRDTVPLAEFVAFLPGARDYLVRRNAKKHARAIVEEAIIAAKARYEEAKVNPEAATVKSYEEGFYSRLIEVSEGDAEPLTVEEVLNNLEAVQVAAQTPLLVTLPNLLYNLAHDPTTQKAIVAEISKVSRSLTEPLRLDDMRQLTTLDLALKESLRLLPSMPVSYNRSSTKDVYKLPGMWALPKGYQIVVDFLSLQRNPQVYGEDANAFKPDRFKKSVPATAEVVADDLSQFGAAFSPFGRGSFACPGQKIAMDIVKLAAAEVLRRYEFLGVKSDGVDVATMEGFESSQGGALRMTAGTSVVIKKRK
ncbi:hypothetical protein HDU76_004856 [Blyttiomyces sp. JEL0837]|nr:hypothetical protein HDU76_004856 [Blyttiomyces sp. JEL0837]